MLYSSLDPLFRVLRVLTILVFILVLTLSTPPSNVIPLSKIQRLKVMQRLVPLKRNAASI